MDQGELLGRNHSKKPKPRENFAMCRKAWCNSKANEMGFFDFFN